MNSEAARKMFRHCHINVPTAEDENELQATKKRKMILVALLAVSIIFNNGTMID